MKNEFSKFQQKEVHDIAAQSHQQAQSHTQKEFSTVEDLLRFDSDQTPVPPGVAQRINQSISAEPPPKRPWWKKWFG